MKYVLSLGVNLSLFFYMQLSGVKAAILYLTIMILGILLLPLNSLAQVKQDTTYYYGTKLINTITQKEGNKKTITTYYRSGAKKSIDEYDGNNINGEQVRWYESGIKESENHYKANRLDGRSEKWYPSGLPEYIKNYRLISDKVGQKSYLAGDYLEYYVSGQLKSRGKYDNDKKEGVWEEWNESGLKKSRANFKQGSKYGNYKTWYRTGQPCLDANFNAVFDSTSKIYKEVLNGRYEEYAESGKRIAKGNYKNGKKDGRYREWYASGQLKSDIEYKKGMIAGQTKTWFENGKIETDAHDYQISGKYGNYQDRFEGKYKHYFQNGQIKEEGFYKVGKKSGEWKEYHENGNLASDFNFINGFKSGISKTYWQGGKLYTLEVYQYRELKKDSGVSVLEGQYERYHDNGNLAEKGIYRNGKKEGEWEFFFKDNRPASKNQYYLGNIIGQTESWYENGVMKSKGSFAQSPDSSGIKQHGAEYTFYENGKIEKYSNWYYGEQSGIQKTYYFSGSLKTYSIVIKGGTDYYYTSGDKLSFTFFENGQLMSYSFISSGRNFGPVLSFFMNGNIMGIEVGTPYITNNTIATWFSDGKYKVGETITPETKEKLPLNEKEALSLLERFKHTQDALILPDSNFTGKFRYPASGDVILCEAQFKNGILDGDFKSYHGNGKIAATEHISNGLVDGPFAIYYDNGNLFRKGTYKNGKPNGIWEDYGAKGFKFNEYAFDEKGKKRIWQKEYYENSNQVKVYYDNVGDNNKSWYSNGVLISEKTVLDSSIKHYRITQYFDNGRKHYEEEYLQGKKHGLVLYYFDNGQMEFESHYINNKLNGPFTQNYKNGKLRFKGQYSMGLKEGKWQTFDSTGKLKESYYDKGIEKETGPQLACACTGDIENAVSYAPTLNNLTKLEAVRKWSFNYHAPIDEMYNDLFYRNIQFSSGGYGSAEFYSFDLLAYREVYVRIPDNRGMKLILNYCGAGKMLTQNHVSATVNTKNGSETYIIVDGKRFALEFSPRLLVQDLPPVKEEPNNEGPGNLKPKKYLGTDDVPLNESNAFKSKTKKVSKYGSTSGTNYGKTKVPKKVRRLKEYDFEPPVIIQEVPKTVELDRQSVGRETIYESTDGIGGGDNGNGYYNSNKNDVASVFSFKCKQLEYNEREGIVLNDVSEPCFPPSIITGTGISISFKKANIDLNAFKNFDSENKKMFGDQRDSLSAIWPAKTNFSSANQFTGLVVDSAQLQIPLRFNGTTEKIKVPANAYKLHISNLEMDAMVVIKAEADKDNYTINIGTQKFTIKDDELLRQLRYVGCRDVTYAYLPERKALVLYFHIKHY